MTNPVLIYGGGRWSKTIIQEIKKYLKQNEIRIFTKNKNNVNDWIKKNKLKKISYLKNDDYKKIKYAIICNSNKNHFKAAKELLKKKINILIEKPLDVPIWKIIQLKKKAKKNKVKIFIGMQFFYSTFFLKIRKKIKKDKIKQIKITWNDAKDEKVDGILKKHDKKISFKKDIFYHIYPIIYKLIGKKINLKKNSVIINNNKCLSFNLDNIKIITNFSKNSVERQRLIKIETNKKTFFIDFTNYKKCYLKYDKINKRFTNKTLIIQYKKFFQSKLNNKLHNNLQNLDDFFLNFKYL